MALGLQKKLQLQSKLGLDAVGGVGGSGGTPARIPVGARLGTSGSGYVFTSTPAAGASVFRNRGLEYVNNTGKTLNAFKVAHSFWKQNNVDSYGIYLLDPASLIGGSGYTTASCSASGGSGSGATFGVVISGGVVTAVYITTNGSGWLQGETPTLTITGDGTGASIAVLSMDGAGEINYPYGAATEADSIEYPIGTYTQILYSGAASKSNVAPGDELESDVLTLATGIAPGDKFRLKYYEVKWVAPTFVAVKTANTVTSWTISNGGSGLYASSYSMNISGGAGTGAAATAYTFNGAICAVVVSNAGSGYTGTPTGIINFLENQNVPIGPLTSDVGNTTIGNLTLASAAAITVNNVSTGPTLLTALPSGYLKGAAVIGDSIATGFSGGDVVGDYLNGYGWPARIVGPLGIGLCKVTAPGYYASSFVTRNTKQMAHIARSGARNVIFALGVNDIQRGDSFATIQANILASWTVLANAGYRVIGCTIGPCATSSNNWTDYLGQTPNTGFGPSSICQQLNDWIRTTPAPISAYIDYDAMVSPTPNSSIWFYIPNRNNGVTSSSPGIHPTDIGHAMVRGRVGALSIATPGAGYLTPPTLSFTNLGIPLATANFTTNTLTSVTLNDDGGRDYDFPPPIQILAKLGAGSGATAIATMTGKRITGFTVTAPGSGYTSGAYVGIGGASPPQASCTLTGDGIGAVSLDFPGSDLLQAPTVVVSGGSGSGGAISATLLQAIQASMFV